jgi:hypothetical protein
MKLKTWKSEFAQSSFLGFNGCHSLSKRRGWLTVSIARRFFLIAVGYPDC